MARPAGFGGRALPLRSPGRRIICMLGPGTQARGAPRHQKPWSLGWRIALAPLDDAYGVAQYSMAWILAVRAADSRRQAQQPGGSTARASEIPGTRQRLVVQARRGGHGLSVNERFALGPRLPAYTQNHLARAHDDESTDPSIAIPSTIWMKSVSIMVSTTRTG
jgi:hypothetical protein